MMLYGFSYLIDLVKYIKDAQNMLYLKEKQFEMYFLEWNFWHLKTHSIAICPFPDSKVHGANMGPTWVLSAPDGPHVGPMNLAIRVRLQLERNQQWSMLCWTGDKPACEQIMTQINDIIWHQFLVINLVLVGIPQTYTLGECRQLSV